MTNVKLDTPVQYLKGVGPKVAKLLKKLGVEAIEDLIYLFPRTYEDRTNIKPIGSLAPADFEVVKGEVISLDHQLTRNRFSVLKIVLSDRSGSIQVVWFNQPYLQKVIRRGMRLIVSGKVEFSSFDNTMQISAKDFEVFTGQNPKIVPIYALTEGLYPKKTRSIVQAALDNCLEMIDEWLPEDIRKYNGLADLQESINKLHYPEKIADVEPARRRLVFDDFFLFQLSLGLRRTKIQRDKGFAFKIDQKAVADFCNSLPFKLTAAQDRVLSEIISDMQSDYPMNRLLQGDVGSGKTIVAAIAALIAIQNGYQAAIMAPTEILAQQHYAKLTQLLDGYDIKIKLLTGSTKKKPTR
ncbi:MAG: DEAD/DEAH box helicase, partial [Candidatus Margulisbacteria bacterium]|nr:DEAD/DEAH box helicase [Candidatus Margulisiibacteriota bacterium]